VNASGTVVGWSDTPTIREPIVWQNGETTALPVPGYGDNEATAINDAGTIVGDVQKPSTSSWEYATQWKDGVLSYLPPLQGGQSAAWAINANGDTVGYSDTGAFTNQRGVLWRGGAVTQLFGGNLDGQAQGLNSTDQVVGNVRTCCDALGDPTTQYQAFIWSEGLLRQLTQAPYPQEGAARGMNDAWQVVGTDGAAGGFVWENGAEHLLNSLLDPGSTGWSVTYANAINAKGQIAAVGYQPSTDPSDLHNHALLLTPSGPLAPDTTPPSGSVTLDGGAATTSNPTASVVAPATGSSGIFAVRLSNSPSVAADGSLLKGKSLAPAPPLS
jgi:uncharacterized membrane protein